jgi:alpha/beta superfamily hydrolase
MGGDRRDSRLLAVSDGLAEIGCACLRFDYGPWDDGRGEQADARNALAWTRDNFERVGLFGYSFGGAVAIHAAAELCATAHDDTPDAVSVLAPAATLSGSSTAAAVPDIDRPLQVLYGERDDTVDAKPIADCAREHGHAVEALPADHFFVGQQSGVAESVVAFFDAAMSA